MLLLNNCNYVMTFNFAFKWDQLIARFACLECCIFWPLLGCYALPTLVKICFFNVFCVKTLEKLKKQEICCKILKKMIFLSLHQNFGQGFYSQKKTDFMSYQTYHLNYNWTHRASYHLPPQQKCMCSPSINSLLQSGYHSGPRAPW